MIKKDLIEQINKGYKKVYISNYNKEADGKKMLTSAVYNVKIDLNWDYKELLQETIKKLKSLTRDDRLASTKRLNESKKLKKNTTSDEVKEVIDELLSSYQKSLQKLNEPLDTSEKEERGFITLTHGVDEKDNYLYFTGIEIEKDVIVEGTYKAVNSKDKTIIKEYFRKMLPIEKLKKYKISIDELYKISLTK